MKFYDAAITMAYDNSHDLFHPRFLRELRDALHPDCPYYKFLLRLVARYGPLDVVEIGTYVGTSAAHLAYTNYIIEDVNNPALFGDVVTIDINPDAKRCVDELGLPNITAITGDSFAVLPQLAGRKFDVLFCDGNHTFNSAYGEYFLYRDLIREGGIMMFDDVNLPMDGDEMNVFWDAIPEPKTRLDHLHTTGFGIVEKRAMTVPHIEDAIKKATPIIVSRRKS